MSETIEKNEIFNQIDNFNNQPSNPNDKSSKPFYEAYLYVPREIAQDRAKFFGSVIEQKEFNKIIDLTFGSGNLTSHIVLDNELEYKKLIFNDIEKNQDRVNKDIKLENSEITYNDVLKKDTFSDKYDLVIFNPQIGGSYTSGEINFETSIEPIISDIDIKDYINLEDVDISVNDENREVFIHSYILSKSEMNNKLKDIKIYNYYDVLYQSKETKKEGQKTNIVKFRNNFDKIIKDKSIIVFYGELKHFEILFKDFNYIRYIADEGSDLFIFSKSFTTSVCYEKQNNDFIENKECEKTSQNKEKEVINLENIVNDIKSNLSDLLNIGDIWGIDENKEDKEINQPTKPTPPKPNHKKPFKNFLYKGDK